MDADNGTVAFFERLVSPRPLSGYVRVGWCTPVGEVVLVAKFSIPADGGSAKRRGRRGEPTFREQEFVKRD